MLLSPEKRKQILKELKTYKNLHNKMRNHSLSRAGYSRHEHIADNCAHLMDSISTKFDRITSSDVEVLCLVVDTFATFNHKPLLNKLQERADFDVYTYIEDSKRGGLQRILTKRGTNPTTMSPVIMRTKTARYKKYCHKFQNGTASLRQSRLADLYKREAFSYARAIATNRIKIAPEQLQVTYDYLNTLCHPCIDGSTADMAKRKIYAEMKNPDRFVAPVLEPVAQPTKAEKPIVTTSVPEKETKPKEKTKSIFARVHDKIAEKHANRAEKRAAKREQADPKPEPTTPVAKPERAVFARWRAAAAVLIALVSLTSLNADGLNATDKPTQKPVKKEIKTKPMTAQPAQTATYTADKPATPAPMDSATDAHMRALTNYYNSALDIFTTPKNKSLVLEQIDGALARGNFALTREINRERVAYAYFIYREYGFNPEILNIAIDGKTKLTPEQQTELEQTILAAGERGSGVQKMARERAQQQGRTLSTSHSKFKNATQKQQLQHLKNIGVLKTAKQNQR